MNSVIAIIFVIALAMPFGILFSYSYKIGVNENTWFLFLPRKQITAFAVFMGAVLLLCIYLLSQNRFVYYWDYGGYWTYSYTQMADVFQNPAAAFRNLYRSICEDDYNLLLPTLISIPLKVFGYTFERYVLVNVLCFFIPLMYILLSFNLKLIGLIDSQKPLNTRKGKGAVIVLLILETSFTVFYLAMLKGYIDIAALLPASISLLLFIDYCPEKLDRKQVIRDICISGCLLSAFLFRRYFSFFILGYVCALSLYSVYRSITLKNVQRRHSLIIACCNLLIIGLIALTIMAVFFRPMLVHILTNNYSEQYAGYNASFKDKIGRIFEVFGIWNILLATASMIISLVEKQYRKITIFLGVSAVTTTLAFFHVQNMGIQHVYVIAVEIYLLDVLGIWLIADSIKGKITRFTWMMISIAVSLCGFINCFFPQARPVFSRTAQLFGETYNPFQRNDIPTLNNLVSYLNSLTNGTDTKVYIDASGSILNNSIIDSLDKPYGPSPLQNQCWTADVDLRDGFPTDFLTAGIIVTTEPVQLHLAEGTQEVVRYLSQEVKDPSSPIGRHFIKDSTTFSLDDGVVVYIYKKTSDFDRADLQYLADYFTDYYPGNEKIFADRILNTKG